VSCHSDIIMNKSYHSGTILFRRHWNFANI